MNLSELQEIGIPVREVKEINPEKEEILHLLDDFTIQQWMPLWVRQAGENVQRVPRHPKTIGHLKNICWGQEAAVLASGPSLDDALPYLKAFRGVVFAGNSTMNPCVASGRAPDWFMALDADEHLAIQIEGIDARGVKGILPVYSHPTLPDVFDPDLIWWFGIHDPRHWFLDKGLKMLYPDVDSLLASSCNPAGMIRMAHHMGIRKIYLLGGDCGFTKGRERCSVFHREGGSWVTNGHDSWCDDKSARETVNGIETTLKLKIAAEVITHIAKTLPDLELIDCSQGLLTAFPKKSFKEVVNGID